MNVTVMTGPVKPAGYNKVLGKEIPVNKNENERTVVEVSTYTPLIDDVPGSSVTVVNLVPSRGDVMPVGAGDTDILASEYDILVLYCDITTINREPGQGQGHQRRCSETSQLLPCNMSLLEE
jgi:hypothetical protein